MESSNGILHVKKILWDQNFFHFSSLSLNNSNFQSTWNNSLFLCILFITNFSKIIPWLFHFDQGLVAIGWSSHTYWTYFSLSLSITRMPSFFQKLLIFIKITNFKVILYGKLLTDAFYSRLDVHYVVSLPSFFHGE